MFAFQLSCCGTNPEFFEGEGLHALHRNPPSSPNSRHVRPLEGPTGTESFEGRQS